MNAPADQPTVAQRFNTFHLEVAVISDRLGWVLQHLGVDDAGLSVLHGLHDDLERLLDAQDCREETPVALESLSPPTKDAKPCPTS